MTRAFDLRIKQALDERFQKGLSRQLHMFDSAQAPHIKRDGEALVNFSSNDYLGLASDEDLKRAWQEGLDRYGCGSGASPLVTGFDYAHHQLEQTLCEWLGFDRAILFSSGFSANQALLFSLMQKGDTLLQDKLNHASLMEAGMLSPATMRRFKHNDVDHLQSLLDVSETQFVVTEGVFSMDGDLAPLSAIKKVCTDNSVLIVDDAHGVGQLGPEGKGSCAYAGINPDILVVTFGKAFGLSGAAILCNSQVGDYLTQFARHHVYSTAMPPSLAHALTCAAKKLRGEQWRRDKLVELQACYHESLSDLEGYVETQTAIKPVVIGDSVNAVKLSKRLASDKCWVSAIRPPTVPVGTSRLRITLTVNHTQQQIEHLARSIRRNMECVK